jgi:hypothetical protein
MPARPQHPEAEYEPPQIETVLTPDEVEREVKYAGEVTSPK